MNRKYVSPEMEITKFDVEDVITVSKMYTDNGNSDGASGEGNWVIK